MRSTITSAILFGAAANAAVIAQRQSSNGDEVWKGDGKIQGRFADGTVEVDCKPEDILKTLNDNCYDEGFCKDTWDFSCTEDWTMHITIQEGQFNKDLKGTLIDGIIAAVNAEGVVKERTEVGATGGGCTGCAFFPTKTTKYIMPDFIGISIPNDDPKDVPHVLTVKVSIDDDNGKGFCEVITGAAGAVAGAINGVAGGVGGLAGLFCKLI